jgi:secreted trypsin-like serine protease
MDVTYGIMCQFPLLYQIRSGGGTASLISPRYVLTAAHSLTGVTANDSITVFYGASNHTQGTAIVLSNTAAHIHPNYTSIFNAELGIIVSTHDMGVLDVRKIIIEKKNYSFKILSIPKHQVNS